jgi:hypothetical protein
MVDRSEFVNSKAVYSALLEELDLEGEEDDLEEDDPVSVAVVETPVPVPVSSCALALRAARHSAQICRDNMITVPPVIEVLSSKRSRGESVRSGQRSAGARVKRRIEVSGTGRWGQIRSTESSTGRLRRAGNDGSTTALIPTESRGGMQTLVVLPCMT